MIYFYILYSHDNLNDKKAAILIRNKTSDISKATNFINQNINDNVNTEDIIADKDKEEEIIIIKKKSNNNKSHKKKSSIQNNSWSNSNQENSSNKNKEHDSNKENYCNQTNYSHKELNKENNQYEQDVVLKLEHHTGFKIFFTTNMIKSVQIFLIILIVSAPLAVMTAHALIKKLLQNISKAENMIEKITILFVIISLFCMALRIFAVEAKSTPILYLYYGILSFLIIFNITLYAIILNSLMTLLFAGSCAILTTILLLMWAFYNPLQASQTSLYILPLLILVLILSLFGLLLHFMFKINISALDIITTILSIILTSLFIIKSMPQISKLYIKILNESEKKKLEELRFQVDDEFLKICFNALQMIQEILRLFTQMKNLPNK